MTNNTTSRDALREQLWDIMSRRNQKILDAQKTDALVLPYFEADNEAADEILKLIEAARIDEVKVIPRVQHNQQLEAYKTQRLAELKSQQTKPGGTE